MHSRWIESSSHERKAWRRFFSSRLFLKHRKLNHEQLSLERKWLKMLSGSDSFGHSTPACSVAAQRLPTRLLQTLAQRGSCRVRIVKPSDLQIKREKISAQPEVRFCCVSLQRLPRKFRQTLPQGGSCRVRNVEQSAVIENGYNSFQMKQERISAQPQMLPCSVSLRRLARKPKGQCCIRVREASSPANIVVPHLPVVEQSEVHHDAKAGEPRDQKTDLESTSTQPLGQNYNLELLPSKCNAVPLANRRSSRRVPPKVRSCLCCNTIAPRSSRKRQKCARLQLRSSRQAAPAKGQAAQCLLKTPKMSETCKTPIRHELAGVHKSFHAAHPAKLPHCCQLCTLSFWRPDQLALHAKSHMADKVKCYSCKRRFANAHTLALHIRLHQFLNLSCSNMPSLSSLDLSRLPRELRDSYVSGRIIYVGNSGAGVEHAASLPPDSSLEDFIVISRAAAGSDLKSPKINSVVHNSSVAALICQVALAEKRLRQQQVPGVNLGMKDHVKVSGTVPVNPAPLVPAVAAPATEERWKCAKCQMLLSSKALLLRHCRNRCEESTGIPFRCTECRVCFPSYFLLELHRSVHSQNSFKCRLCNLSLSRKDLLEEHQATHTDHLYRRPHPCQVCPASFELPHQLASHQSKHSIERPFVCQRCGKEFMAEENLSRHLSGHLSSVDSVRLPEPVEPPFGEGLDLEEQLLKVVQVTRTGGAMVRVDGDIESGPPSLRPHPPPAAVVDDDHRNWNVVVHDVEVEPKMEPEEYYEWEEDCSALSLEDFERQFNSADIEM